MRVFGYRMIKFFIKNLSILFKFFLKLHINAFSFYLLQKIIQYWNSKNFQFISVFKRINLKMAMCQLKNVLFIDLERK